MTRTADKVGGRELAIRAAVLGFVALAFAACERKSLDGGTDASTVGGFGFDAAFGDGGFEDVAITAGATIGGLTIVTQSFQTSPATAHDFSVALQ